MFALMFVGGCAGSTTCGIKIFRLQVLYAAANAQIHRLLQPNGVFFPYYNGKPIPDGVASSVMSFFFLFAACRSEEHTSELQSLMRISYAVFCLKKKKEITVLPRVHQYRHTKSTYAISKTHNNISF